MSKQQIYKMVATAVTALLTCVAIALGLQSCNVTRTVTTRSEAWQKGDNVTRTVTTRSEAWQKGDPSVVIQTKTVESYDAEKKLY